jgi:hypothetical protein
MKEVSIRARVTDNQTEDMDMFPILKKVISVTELPRINRLVDVEITQLSYCLAKHIFTSLDKYEVLLLRNDEDRNLF